MDKYGGRINVKSNEQNIFDILGPHEILKIKSQDDSNTQSEHEYYKSFFNDLSKLVDIFWVNVLGRNPDTDKVYDENYRIFFNRYLQDVYQSLNMNNKKFLSTYRYLKNLIDTYNKKRAFYILFHEYRVPEVPRNIKEYKEFLEWYISLIQNEKYVLWTKEKIDISKIKKQIIENIADPFQQNVYLNAFENLVPYIEAYNNIIDTYISKSAEIFGNNLNRTAFVNRNMEKEDRISTLNRIIRKLTDRLPTIQELPIFDSVDNQFIIPNIYALANQTNDSDTIIMLDYVLPFVEEYNLLTSARRFLNDERFFISVPQNTENVFEIVSTIFPQINRVLQSIFPETFYIPNIGEKYYVEQLSGLSETLTDKRTKETFEYVNKFMIYYNSIIDSILTEIFGENYYDIPINIRQFKKYLQDAMKNLWERLEYVPQNNQNKLKNTQQYINEMTDMNKKFKFQVALKYILPLLNYYEEKKKELKRN